jgi:hypothetical protein
MGQHTIFSINLNGEDTIYNQRLSFDPLRSNTEYHVMPQSGLSSFWNGAVYKMVSAIQRDSQGRISGEAEMAINPQHAEPGLGNRIARFASYIPGIGSIPAIRNAQDRYRYMSEEPATRPQVGAGGIAIGQEQFRWHRLESIENQWVRLDERGILIRDTAPSEQNGLVSAWLNVDAPASYFAALTGRRAVEEGSLVRGMNFTTYVDASAAGLQDMNRARLVIPTMYYTRKGNVEVGGLFRRPIPEIPAEAQLGQDQWVKAQTHIGVLKGLKEDIPYLYVTDSNPQPAIMGVAQMDSRLLPLLDECGQKAKPLYEQLQTETEPQKIAQIQQQIIQAYQPVRQRAIELNLILPNAPLNADDLARISKELTPDQQQALSANS